MIPNKAYEIAQNAGWTPADVLHTGNYIADTKFRDCTTALDPLFFQALGKELGWGGSMQRIYNGAHENSVDTLNMAAYNAHRFYDLILTTKEGSEDRAYKLGEFWDDLLAHTK